jgi:hypothetical protein
MSPRRSTRAPKRRRDTLSHLETFDLLFGNPCRLSFATEELRRAAWVKHGPDLMTRWTKTDRLPWGHYVYDLNIDPPTRPDPRRTDNR